MEAIQKERSNIDFDQDELSTLVFGGKDKFEEHKKTLEFFRTDPVLKTDHTFYNLPREEQIGLNYKRIARMKELHKLGTGFPELSSMNVGTLADYSGSVSSLGLHYAMFETVIKFLGSDEQCKEYLSKIANVEITGCYAQTEIGHGSDVASLETTATFDPASDSFIVNSPTTKSGKFWPGELGKTATHAAFHAQLITKGKSYGVQTFVCQIRDMDSQRPLRGLEIGDIGAKGGYQQKDNGYMYFNNFKIPRTALLSRYTKVDKKGNFSIKGNPKFAYASMMFVRVYLIHTASLYTAKALIVGLKYGLVRKQFKTIANSKEERSIIEYHSYQNKVTPIVAFSYASLFTKQRIVDIFVRMMDKINTKNDFKLMKEMHNLGSCMKAHYTQVILDYLKDIRECCGGHGFSDYAGINNLIDIGAPNVTLEGDNIVMYQQTARALLKSMSKIVQGKQLKGSVSYLNDMFNYQGKELTDFDPSNLEQLESILKVHSLYHLGRVGQLMQSDPDTSFLEKWNKKYQIDIIKVANAHAVYITAASFVEGLQNNKFSKNLKKHLLTLCQIHLCHSIVTYGDGALLSGYVKAEHLHQVEDFLQEKIAEIRPQILNLVEAFHYPEGTINTVIRPEGGNPYENLYEAASHNPVNKTTKLESFDECVTPLKQRLSSRL